jgi:cytochrome c oxidase subunit 4
MTGKGDDYIIHDDGHADTHGEHHGHVIVSQGTLVAVFSSLLFFTLLTVGLAQAEKAFSHTYDFIIPQWVNVLIAMSIACVKTTLVVLYFMQLRYDNPINGMVFIFTILTVLFFLGFTFIDLGNRGTIYAYKAQYIEQGGKGLNGAGPITKTAADAASEPGHPLHELWEHAHGHGAHEGEAHLRRGAGDGTLIFDDAPMDRSGQEHSRPIQGLTLPGFAKPAEEGSAEHATSPAGEHAPPANPATTSAPAPAKPAKPAEPEKPKH